MTARKPRKRSVTLSLDGAGSDGADPEMPPESATAAIAAEQEQEAAATRVPQAVIRRSNPDTGKDSYLDSVALSLVSEEWIAKTYGGGKYRVYKMGTRPDNKWGFIGQDTYDIDESIPFKGSLGAQRGRRAALFDDDDAPIRVMSPGDSPADEGMNTIMKTGVLTLLKAQQDQSAMTQQMTMGMMQAAAANQTMMQQAMLGIMEQMRESGKSRLDIVALIGALTPLLAPLLTALMTKKGSDLDVVLTMMEKLKPAEPSQKFSDMLELVKQMKETADVFGPGDGEGGGGMMKVLSTAVAALAPMLVERATAQPVATARAVPGAATPLQPIAAAPADISLPQPEATVQGPLDLLAPHIPKLLMAARLNRRPRVVADMVYEFAPDEQRGLIRELLADVEFETKFVARFPEVTMHPDWMTELLAELRIAFIGEDEGEDGDGDGAEPDAGAGAPGAKKE